VMRKAWRRGGRAGWPLGVLLAALAALVLAGCGMPEGGTPQGREINRLWAILFVSGGAVFVLVEGAIIWAVVRYRRRDDELPRQTHGNNLLEIVWTLIPLVIVTVLFVWGWGGINALARESPNPDRVIRVEGFQWQWNFTYVGERLAVKPGEEERSLTLEGTIARPPELVLPVGDSVRFELQSADVIHSFFVPGWNYKQDVVPGRTNSFEVTPDRLGRFPGQCAEYCGLAHNDMHFTVRVVEAAEFTRWLAEAKRQAVSGCPNEPNPLSISSVQVAFDKNCMAAPAGRPFQITYDNKEAVQHNIAIFRGNDASGENVFRGELFSGPRVVEYRVRALQAGAYYFHCDVHPTAMKGKLNVQ
jgi:cytochrome c oxidase subunit II